MMPPPASSATPPLPLFARRVQIAGSASGKTEAALTAYAHQVVSNLVKDIMAAGGGIVVGIGKEPRPEGAAPDAPSLLFDWTALETAAECLKHGFPAWPAESGLPIVIASSEKAVMEIPDNRRPLYEELLRSGLVHVESIMPGSRAAAFLRQRQAIFGDSLVILGGGTGVEHLADQYLARRKPVVPLDLALGASREDGTGGAMRLAKEARAEPARFLRFSTAYASTEGAALAEIATRNGAAAASDVAARTVSLLSKIARPTAFYVRLLNPDHPKCKIVESFFRNVVDPVVDEAGMRRVEMGADKNEYAFMNVAIFESVHFSSVAIVDVTGERPNCFIELGYALRGGRVLVTAEDGTKLPFDQEMIPCHFWKPGDSVADRKKALVDFWQKNINRTAHRESGIAVSEDTVKEVYISVDIEAAGPVPATYSMLSLGAVAVDEPTQTFYAEFKPVNDNFVPGAMKVVGRSLRDFADKGRSPKETMADFRDWLAHFAKAKKPVFVGFNATFDWAFVNYYFHQYLGENPFGFGGIDIKSYYMGMTGCAWEDTRSSRIRSELKGLFPHTHNALDDAVEQAEMFKRMREKARQAK